MARKPKLRQQIEALIASLEPDLRDAFQESIETITSEVILRQVVTALEARDVTAAIEALNIDAAAFRPLERAITTAFEAGGVTTARALPNFKGTDGAEVVFRFDVRNPAAEEWLGTHSSELITGIMDETKVIARTTIMEGYAAGKGPQDIALDIVGRVDRTTGNRAGGILGLTEQQQGYVSSARTELLSGDPAKLKNYLKRKARDKRFDRAVMQAIKDGKPFDADTAARITGRYSDRLLKIRGDTIAQAETLQAVQTAKHQSVTQAAEAGGYTDQDIKKTWRTAGDGKVRHTHASLNGTSVYGLETPFVTSSGAKLLYPGDTSLGAGPSEIVRCRCDDDVDFDFSVGVD